MKVFVKAFIILGMSATIFIVMMFSSNVFLTLNQSSTSPSEAITPNAYAKTSYPVYYMNYIYSDRDTCRAQCDSLSNSDNQSGCRVGCVKMMDLVQARQKNIWCDDNQLK